MNGLRHDLLRYNSPEQFAARTAPFIAEGVARGDGTVVATRQENAAALAARLGRTADDVLFVPAADVYRRPIDAIAAYHNVLSTFAANGRTQVRAIGEPLYDDGDDGASWLVYEPAAHHVFEDAPLHVICPYNEQVLPASIVQHATRTHPFEHAEDGHREPLAGFIQPEEMLAMLPRRATPGIEGEPDLSMTVEGGDIGTVRREIGSRLAMLLPRARAEEALLAIGELLANGVRHGGGRIEAHLWSSADSVVCAIRNQGRAIVDRFAGFHPPSDAQRGGMGLWIARQIADDLAIDAGELGPVVTVAFRRAPA